MPRPRTFDADTALDAALEVFWTHGFDGCSIQDLLDAMNINRQSLYNTFGDKRTLFLRVLKRYQQRLEEELAPLRSEDAGLDVLYAFAHKSVASQQEHGAGACLMVMTAFSPHIEDPELAKVIRYGSKVLRRCLSEFVEANQKRGELPDSLVPSVTANVLYAVLNGLSALSRTGASNRAVRESAKLALSQLTLGASAS